MAEAGFSGVALTVLELRNLKPDTLSRIRAAAKDLVARANNALARQRLKNRSDSVPRSAASSVKVESQRRSSETLPAFEHFVIPFTLGTISMRVASAAPRPSKPLYDHWFLLGMLGLALLLLFSMSLEPHQVLFANDSPLGARHAECNRLPSRFTGTWSDLSWLGGEGPAASPSITMLSLTLFSAVAWLKIYAPFTLLFLGFSAWLFFRQLNFHPIVCLIAGVAAGLNAHFFSIACWGLGNWNIAAGCAFLALAAFCSKSIPKVWERAVMAGLAVGMGIMEGYDVAPSSAFTSVSLSSFTP